MQWKQSLNVPEVFSKQDLSENFMRYLVIIYLYILLFFARALTPPEDETASLRAKLSQCEMKVIELSKEEEAKKAKKAALKAKRSLLKDCSTHQSCDLCFASGCAWCLGERACVSDEAWMCQGEDDHVGRIGRVKGCPSVIDVGEEKEEEGEEAEVPAEKVVKQVGRVGGGEGKCEAAESGCFGQKICACEREPRRQCTCGEVGDSNGCCNCGCGLCDEMCAGAGDQDQGGLRDAEEGATQQRNASGIHQLTRDELLRVKVEMEVGADGEGEVKEGGEEYSEAEISKCEFVKEKAKIDALDDPYEALNMTDSATTAEVSSGRRAKVARCLMLLYAIS